MKATKIIYTSAIDFTIYSKGCNDYFKPIEFMTVSTFKRWKLSTCFNMIKDWRNTCDEKYFVEHDGVEYFGIIFLPCALIYCGPETSVDIYDAILGHCETRDIDDEDSEESDSDPKISSLETRIDKLESLMTSIASDIKSLKSGKH